MVTGLNKLINKEKHEKFRHANLLDFCIDPCAMQDSNSMQPLLLIERNKTPNNCKIKGKEHYNVSLVQL